MKKKKLFPSQKTYQMNNPSTTFRLKKDDKEKLDRIIKITGTSLSKFMTDFLHDKLIPYEIYEAERETIVDYYDDICDELKTEERFSISCARCAKLMTFSSREPDWTSKYYPVLKKAFGNWRHVTCKSS
jgi:hypothetical protein